MKMSRRKRTDEIEAKTARKKEASINEWKDAYILHPELGAALIGVLQEMPIKFSKEILPLLQELQKAPRSNVKVNMNPKPGKPIPPAGRLTGQKPEKEDNK